MRKKFVDESGICYSVTENSFTPTVSISKIPVGTKFYAEPNSVILSSAIANGNTGGTISRRLATMTDFQSEDQRTPHRATLLGQMCANFVAGTQQTTERRNVGERSYVIYEALANDQRITFTGSHDGDIICWNAKPLKDDENFVDSTQDSQESIDESEENTRYRGPLCVIKNTFLVASLNVKSKVYHQTGDSNRDILVKQFSKTDNTFQHFSGDGYVMLQAFGGAAEFPLCPGEKIDVWPGCLLGFTEGITLEMKPSGDASLRSEELSDYVIRLTAPQKGGIVLVQTGLPSKFF